MMMQNGVPADSIRPNPQTQPPQELNIKAILERVFGPQDAAKMTAPPLSPQQELLKKLFGGM
jgi:hypothetical protein